MERTAPKPAPIVDALEEDILFGRLRTRERLIEDELIDRFGATRHAQICAVREMLHAQAAALIPIPAPAPLLQRLERLHEQHSREVERGNLRGIHQVNSLFHETLFEACGNPYLVQTIRDYAQMSLAFRCHVMVNPFLARRTRDEHGQMLAALRRGDRAKLVRLCARHTQPAKELYFSLRGFATALAPVEAATRAATARKSAAQPDPAMAKKKLPAQPRSRRPAAR